jgi:hypothetical protein
MLAWGADDHQDHWIYRTILPNEVRIAEHRLIQFKNMEEEDAEAEWNYDNHRASDGAEPLVMRQRRRPTEEFPMGLSFVSFENDHLNLVMSADLPDTADTGDVFAVIVENNPAAKNSSAYNQIVGKRSQPKKIRNAAGAVVTLKAYICYKANSASLTADSPFCCLHDNNPPIIRTVAPAEGSIINCIECSIGSRLAAEPMTVPTLFTMIEFRMHCFRMHAAAEPKPLLPSFNRDVHRLACVFYRGFDTDCSEEDSKNIVAILRFLEQFDYLLSALKLLRKQCVIDLLQGLFSSEFLDEEETKEVVACLLWMRNDFDSCVVSNLELTGRQDCK